MCQLPPTTHTCFKRHNSVVPSKKKHLHHGWTKLLYTIRNSALFLSASLSPITHVTPLPPIIPIITHQSLATPITSIAPFIPIHHPHHHPSIPATPITFIASFIPTHHPHRHPSTSNDTPSLPQHCSLPPTPRAPIIRRHPVPHIISTQHGRQTLPITSHHCHESTI